MNQKLWAIVAVCIGVGLLVFGTPAGLPTLAGPAAAGFWPLVALACLILGLIGLTQGVDIRWRREAESEGAASRTIDRPCSEGQEAKLRQLLRLKDEKLITEEEYTRKRTEILEKW